MLIIKMKKVFLLLVAIISLSVAASAQKFGHITTDDIIQAMPETKLRKPLWRLKAKNLKNSSKQWA